MNHALFKDRDEAGKKLADALSRRKRERAVVLAIPRGGVVVARAVASALGAELDVVVSRKIGAPGEPEYALGAVTQDGEVVVDEQAMNALGVGMDYIETEAAKKSDEVKERLQKFRGARPYPSLVGRRVIVVDDGIATGHTMLAALRTVRKAGAATVAVAVPVAPPETVERLSEEADEVVCLATPEPFFAIGEFYADFAQVDDGDVRKILDEYRENRRK